MVWGKKRKELELADATVESTADELPPVPKQEQPKGEITVVTTENLLLQQQYDILKLLEQIAVDVRELKELAK